MRIIDLINEVNEKSYTKLEKLRYIYIQLANFFAYDEQYLFGYDSEYAIDIYNRTIDFNYFSKMNLQNKTKIVCKQPAEILVQVLSKVGIKAENIGYKKGEQRHITTIVYLDDKKYILNLSKDLMNLQKGFKTRYFGKETYEANTPTIQYDVFDEKKKKKIDKKQGYSYNGIYMDDVLQTLKKEIMNVDIFEQFLKEQYPNLKDKELKKDIIANYKLNFIFEHIKNIQSKNKKLEIYEMEKFYNIIIQYLFTSEERQKIDDTYIYNENGESSLIYSIKVGDKYIYYEYDDKTRSFHEKSKEIVKMKKQQRKIEEFAYQKIPGLKER